MPEIKYSPEIDGLRAIAVTSVLLFHLGFSAVPGGFVGVDVFFVISGFLITRLIYSEIQSTHQFSFSNFYARRAKRLFPALYFTLTVCLLIGIAVLPPQLLERLGASAAHALLSISNLFFWTETGYFDLEATKKPLLHTWSLSVEEQFYLVWPIMMLVLVRLSGVRPFRVVAFLIFLGLVSLISSEYFLDEYPHTVFYMTPFRVYEFVLGALVIWIPKKFGPNDIRMEICLAGGLGLVLYSMLTLDPASRFPGLNALYATLGTALAIYSYEAKFVGQLLRNRPAVFIGLISYSLYLVHWPIIVFYEYVSNSKVENNTAFILGTLSVISAVLMYRYIEKPFRKGSLTVEKTSPAAVAFTVSALMIALLYFTFTLVYSNGWPDRIKDRLPPSIDIEARAGGATWAKIRSLEKSNFSHDGRAKIFVIGDSQAGDLVNILDNTLPRDKFEIVASVTRVYCGSLFVPAESHQKYFKSNWRIQEYKNTSGMTATCKREWKKWQNSRDLLTADYVLLSSLWYAYQLPHIEETIRYIRQRTDAQIILIGNKALPFDSREMATRCALLSFLFPLSCSNSIKELNQFAAKFLDTGGRKTLGFREKSFFEVSRSVENIAQDANVKYVDMYKHICDDYYRSCSVYTKDGRATYKDSAHFSTYGTELIAERLKALNFLGAGT